MIFKSQFKNIKNIDNLLSFFFLILIIVGSLLNTVSNKTYQNDSWTIGEWLINYQGGFVRRGFLGEIIYFLSSSIKISPIFVIWFICLFSYFLLIKLVLKEAKGKVSSVFILSPSILLAPVIGDFLIRKDILLMLMFLTNLKVCQSKNPNLFLFNILNIFGTLVHESFAIYSLPIETILLSNKSSLTGKNIKLFYKILPSFLMFIICFIFKGNNNQAIHIHESWLDQPFLFPFENLKTEFPLGAINAIGWDIQNILNILKNSLINFEGIIWVPFAWFITLILLALFFLGDFSFKDFKIKFFILSVQFLPFSILCFSGWDYGRWIFIWILSSILIYCTIGEELKTFKLVQNSLKKFNLIEKFLYKIKINKRSNLLLLIFAYPHCCWSIYYMPGLLIIPIYYCIQSRKFIINSLTNFLK